MILKNAHHVPQATTARNAYLTTSTQRLVVSVARLATNLPLSTPTTDATLLAPVAQAFFTPLLPSVY
jgi:hypothetical protein